MSTNLVDFPAPLAKSIDLVTMVENRMFNEINEVDEFDEIIRVPKKTKLTKFIHVIELLT